MIILQIGLPLEENFSSYSVMMLPSLKTGSLCRSKVDGRDAREVRAESAVSAKRGSAAGD